MRKLGGLSFTLLVLVEVVYFVGRLQIQILFPEEPQQERLIDIWRAAFICIYAPWIDWRGARKSARNIPRHPLVLIAVACAYVAVVATGSGWETPFSTLYAVSALIPSMREELFYRGILQPYLVNRYGAAVGILASGVAFVLLHTGMHDVNISNVAMLLSTSVLLGILFLQTRNIWLVIAIHTVANLLAALLPVSSHVSGPTIFLMSAISVVAIEAWRQGERTRERLEA